MVDWSRVEPAVAEALARNAELYLDHLHRIATSQDARGSALAAAFTSATIALLAFAGSHPDLSLATLLAIIAVSLCWITASGLCLSTLLPRLFPVAGIQPREWFASAPDLTTAYFSGYLAEEYQGRIDTYFQTEASTAFRLYLGVLLGAIAAPVVSAVVWIIISLATA